MWVLVQHASVKRSAMLCSLACTRRVDIGLATVMQYVLLPPLAQGA